MITPVKKLLSVTAAALLVSCSSTTPNYRPSPEIFFGWENEYLRVDERCIKKSDSRSKFLGELNRATEQGFGCLTKLNTKNSLHLRDEIKKIFKLQKAEVVCPEEYQGKSFARASSPKLDGKDRNLIAVNIHRINRGVKNDDIILAGVFFHEFFHLTGLRHNTDIEYPYACEYYCFPSWAYLSEYRPIGIEIARDICAGKYNNINSEEYLRKSSTLFMIWETKLHGQLSNIRAFLSRNPENRYAWLLLSRILFEHSSWMVGAEFAFLLEDFYKEVKLTELELRYIYDYKVRKNEYQSELIAPSKKLANALNYLRRAEFQNAENELRSYKLSNSKGAFKADKFDRIQESFQAIYDFIDQSLSLDRSWLERGAKNL